MQDADRCKMIDRALVQPKPLGCRQRQGDANALKNKHSKDGNSRLVDPKRKTSRLDKRHCHVIDRAISQAQVPWERWILKSRSTEGGGFASDKTHGSQACRKKLVQDGACSECRRHKKRRVSFCGCGGCLRGARRHRSPPSRQVGKRRAHTIAGPSFTGRSRASSPSSSAGVNLPFCWITADKLMVSGEVEAWMRVK